MTRRPLLLVPVLGLALGLVSVPTQAAPGPDPAALPVGDAPEVAWQSGATVRLASGKTVTLPAGASGEVLGRRKGEWLVAVDGGEPEVLAVKAGRVRTVWHHTYDESATDYSLVAGADQVVEWNYTRGTTSYGTVLDLQGEVVGTRSWNGYADLLDADADGLLVSGRKQTLRWIPGEKPVPVGPAAYFADIEHDLLVVPVGEDALGPTSLTAPGTPAWSAAFDAESVSPDGTWIAGVTYTRRPRLVVRRLTDGVPAPVPAFVVDRDPIMVGGSHVEMTWEPDGDLLLVVRGAKGRAVVRCSVTGSCERATAWVKGQVLAFPS